MEYLIIYVFEEVELAPYQSLLDIRTKYVHDSGANIGLTFQHIYTRLRRITC
jgi:hypothetical protein